MKSIKKICLISIIFITVLISMVACDFFVIKHRVQLQVSNILAGTCYGGGSYKKGEVANLVANSSQDDGFVWQGFFIGNELLTEEMTYDYMVEKDVTILAKWKGIDFNIKVYSQTDNDYSNLNYLPYEQTQIEYGTKKTIVIEETGYIFKGLYLETNFQTQVADENGFIDTFLYKENITLFAKWEAITYTLNLTSNLELNFNEYPKTATYNQVIQVGFDNSLIDENLTFLGWYVEDVKVSSLVNFSFYMPAKNVELVAKFPYTDGFIYEDINDDKARIISYVGDKTEVFIPTYYEEKLVTEISENCFVSAENKNAISKVVIPYSIESINQNAFNEINATFYFDIGSKLSNINTQVFNTQNKIYVHIVNTLTTNDLIDGYYSIYNGEFCDSDLNSENEHIGMFYSFWLYNVTNNIPLNIDYNFSGEVDDYLATFIEDEFGYIPFKSNIKNAYSYSVDMDNDIITYKFSLSSVTIASKTTDLPVCQEETNSVVVAYKNLENQNRNLQIYKKPYQTVKNSEQLLYAVENGYQPIFIENCTAKTIYEKAIEILNNINTDDMTELQKITSIHDYICNNNIYDTKLLNLVKNNATNSQQYRGFYLEGVFIDGVAVCDGISKAFSLLCKMEGIEVCRVSGTCGDTGHAWNKVKLDGKWYIVDVTNDDIISSGSEILSHRYFLVSDEEFSSFATQSEGNYPVCTTSYRIDFYENLTIDNRSVIVTNQIQLNLLASNLKDMRDSGNEGEKFTMEIVIHNDILPSLNLRSAFISYYQMTQELSNDYCLYIIILTK